MKKFYETHKVMIETGVKAFKSLEAENREKIKQFIDGGYSDMRLAYDVFQNGFHLRDIQASFSYGNPHLFGHLTGKERTEFYKFLKEKGIDMKKKFIV